MVRIEVGWEEVEKERRSEWVDFENKKMYYDKGIVNKGEVEG